MMIWLSTWLFHPALAAGATAVASPILIHLLSRRRFRRVRWAAIEFLLQAHNKNRRRVKMEQMILLALRCLAIILLAMMVARPFIRPGIAAALLGSAPRTERIIVLDDSFSTAYQQAGRSVFEDARSAAARLARWIGSELPDDSLTILLTSRPRQPLLALTNLSESCLQQLDERLRTLSPSRRPARPADAVAAVTDLLARQPVQANTSIYFVSDFQRVDWAGSSQAAPATAPAGSQPSRERSLIAPLADLTQSRTNVRLVMIDVSAENPQNVAITDVRPLSRQVVAGVPGRFSVRVANYSDAELRDLELAISLADQALPPVLVPRIGPRQVVDEPIEVSFPRQGPDYARVGLTEQRESSSGAAATGLAGLTLDNQRTWSGEVLPAIDVLVVDGEPSHDNYKDEVYLFKTALRPEGQAFSGNEVRVVEETELDGMDLSPFHTIVLANVYRVTETGRRALERYVAAGGGLAIYVGQEVDVGLYNESLYADGRGLLPGRLTDVLTAPASADDPGFGLGAWDENHPLFRSFAGAAGELLRRVRFLRVIGSQPAPAATAATDTLSASSAPSTQPERPAASVLATLNDPERTPLIVERPYGRGNVVLIGTTADLDWNNWARDPSYVPFVLELDAYLARGAESPGWAAVGETIHCDVDPNKYAPRVNLRVPGDQTEAPVGLDARPQPDGGFAVTWDQTEEVGVYRFELSSTSGEIETRYAAINPDSRESDLTPSGRAGLTEALPEMKFEYVRDLKTVMSDAAESRREMWWPLLMAAVVVLMAEHALAWWFGARGA